MQKETILIGGDILHPGEDVELFLKRANRHGLISGATGTGKTVTLQILAEHFSKQGIPVFASDVKGDLAGISMPGTDHEKIQERTKHIGIDDWTPRGFPTVFWDLYGKRGHPIRTTVSDMGPILLSRLMNLSDTQDALLHILFKIADDRGRLLLDLDDLEAMLGYMDENAKELRKDYGNMATSSLGAIRRGCIVLRTGGGDKFFGEPALKLEDIMKKDFSGNGVISILDAKELMADSRLYSTFLLRLISELFEQLPEVGDIDKPKLVFFFDEAHLLFRDTPSILLEKVEQVVKLIRSKGVGIYFVTQNPTDIPDIVRSQLGNRVQHALRAFTPKDQKTINIVSDTFRQNEEFDIKESLIDMGVGVGLVSCLDEKGKPQVVKKTLIRPPESRMGILSDEERKEVIERSPLSGKYENMIDRRSADEILEDMETENEQILTKNPNKFSNESLGAYGAQTGAYTGTVAKSLPPHKTISKSKKPKSTITINGKKSDNFIQDLVFGTKNRQGLIETFGKTLIKKGTNDITGKILRGILGGMIK